MTGALACLSLALYWEARGEPDIGQLAVGQVIMNRVASVHYPNTICRVVYQGMGRKHKCQFSYVCDEISDAPLRKKTWDKSVRLARKLMEGEIEKITNADHYHASHVLPFWADSELKEIEIGKHIFYKIRG